MAEILEASLFRPRSIRDPLYTQNLDFINVLEGYQPCTVSTFTMQPSADPVIASPSPSTTLIDEKSGVRFDEKNINQEVAVELQESPRRISPAAYLRSTRDAFSGEKIKQYGTVLVKFGKFTGPGAIIGKLFIALD